MSKLCRDATLTRFLIARRFARRETIHAPLSRRAIILYISRENRAEKPCGRRKEADERESRNSAKTLRGPEFIDPPIMRVGDVSPCLPPFLLFGPRYGNEPRISLATTSGFVIYFHSDSRVGGFKRRRGGVTGEHSTDVVVC